MKIAVPVEENSMESIYASLTAPILIYDTESKENVFLITAVASQGGAGIKAAKPS